MARNNGLLELRKGRQSGAALELNQAQVERYVAVLRAALLPPGLAADTRLLLPGQLAEPLAPPTAQLSGALVLEATLASQVQPHLGMAGQLVIECRLTGQRAQPLLNLGGEYDINVFRGPSAALTSDWQRADPQGLRHPDGWEQGARLHPVRGNGWQEAAPCDLIPRFSHQQGLALGAEPSSGWQEGLPLGDGFGQPVESLPPGHHGFALGWASGVSLGYGAESGYRNPPRWDLDWAMDWQEGARLLANSLGQTWHLGAVLDKGWRDGWDEAMAPPPGVTPPPQPPIKPVRPDKRTKALAFAAPRNQGQLEFVWFGADASIIIPTRRIYLVSNTASIVRVRDGLDIAATAVNIELDTDSWAWQFNAQIPRIAAAEMTDEEEVSIHINGERWDCVCDGWQSSQSFGRESATLTGRSRSAYLSPTHVLPGAVSEAAPAMVQQLAASLLPLGWTLEWQAADWLVPGGFFSLDNQTPIGAIRYLAEAAGGFVLPHQRDRHLVVKPRFPVVPWQLDVSPADIAIPRAIITTLGSDFQPGQSANGIWVNGGHQGISALVKRQGSAGERQAQSITHPLVCDVIAARAQGIVALAQTLPRRTHSIELPLSADTGLILPGVVLAVDNWKGFNRGVRVSAAMQGPAMTVRQQLSVERFV
ncbi:hypothetical protein [Aeromonas molluscorum]